MRLASSVDIKSSPAAIFDFFDRMEDLYTRWHPDHLLFRWEGTPGVHVGLVFYFEERIAGKLLRKRVRFTRVIPDKLIEFAPTNLVFRLFLPRIAFAIEPNDHGVRITQTIEVRTGPIGAWLNRREFAAVQRHMDEEGANMRALLERS